MSAPETYSTIDVVRRRLDTLKQALRDIQEVVEDNIDYCSESGPNDEARIWGIAETALYPGGR